MLIACVVATLHKTHLYNYFHVYVPLGMFMAEALKRCPELIVMKYDFPLYETLSEQVHTW